MSNSNVDDSQSLFDALGIKPRELELRDVIPEMPGCGTIGESASGPEERGREGGVGGGVDGGEEPNRLKGAREVVSLYVRLAKFASDFAPPGGKPIEPFPLIENNFDLAGHVGPLGEALYQAAAHLLFNPAAPGKADVREWLKHQVRIIDASERLSAMFAAVSSDAYLYLREGVATENREKAEVLASFLITEALPLARLFAAGSERYWAALEHGLATGALTKEHHGACAALAGLAELKFEMYREAFKPTCD